MSIFNYKRSPLPFLRLHPFHLGNLCGRLDFCHAQLPPFLTAVCRPGSDGRRQYHIPVDRYKNKKAVFSAPDAQSGKPIHGHHLQLNFTQLALSPEPWLNLKYLIEDFCHQLSVNRLPTSVLCLPGEAKRAKRGHLPVPRRVLSKPVERCRKPLR